MDEFVLAGVCFNFSSLIIINNGITSYNGVFGTKLRVGNLPMTWSSLSSPMAASHIGIIYIGSIGGYVHRVRDLVPFGGFGLINLVPSYVGYIV